MSTMPHAFVLPQPEPLGLQKQSCLSYAAKLHEAYYDATPSHKRAPKGQVFTPAPICRFMAQLLRPFPPALRLLDPGAGVGSLTAAVCDEILKLRSSRKLDLHVYERDEALIPSLTALMRYIETALGAAGHKVSFTIHPTDFLKTNSHSRQQGSLFAETQNDAFDAVIMNPPYYKIGGLSEHASLLRDVVHGQPNVYALFLAVASSMLRPHGRLVAITPRSFCNGPYFREFRRWFFKQMGLSHLHLFDSRKHVFDDILQESVISCSRKDERPKLVAVSASFSGTSLHEARSLEIPADRILHDGHGNAVIRIPTTRTDLQVMKFVESWNNTFAELGLRVSTGPVVSFRARSLLLNDATGASAVPLVLVHNVQRFHTDWPLHRSGKPTHIRNCKESAALLLPSKPYVLLRRFSAKEEARRLTASCYIPELFDGSFIGLENHLNYITHQVRILTQEEVRGIAALLNSSLLDRYFRLASGNTQVNASDIRPMPFPTLKILSALGKKLPHPGELKADELEAAVLSTIGAPASLRRAILRELG